MSICACCPGKGFNEYREGHYPSASTPRSFACCVARWGGAGEVFHHSLKYVCVFVAFVGGVPSMIFWIHFIVHLKLVREKPWQFRKSMMGTSTPSYIEQFWNHCRTCEEWADHPVLQRGGDLGRTFSRLNVMKTFLKFGKVYESHSSITIQFGMFWGDQGHQSKDSYQSLCTVMVPSSFAIPNI